MHKHNASRRHHIGKMKFRVTNWPEYEAGLRRAWQLDLVADAGGTLHVDCPRRTTRGGQPCYSDLAIETTLMLGTVFGLRLRQSEGLLGSVLQLMGLDLAIPDHTTLSRGAWTWQSPNRRPDPAVSPDGLQVYGAGQWLESKHGARSRRGGRKLHLVLTTDSGEIIAHSMTDQDKKTKASNYVIVSRYG